VQPQFQASCRPLISVEVSPSSIYPVHAEAQSPRWHQDCCCCGQTVRLFQRRCKQMHESIQCNEALMAVSLPLKLQSVAQLLQEDAVCHDGPFINLSQQVEVRRHLSYGCSPHGRP
jgi:hypothetical protein